MTCCDWCGENWSVAIGGIIKIHEKAPLDEAMADEIYNFCCYKCLSKWVGL